MSTQGGDWQMREPRSDEGARDIAASSGGWVRSGERRKAPRAGGADGSRELSMVPPDSWERHTLTSVSVTIRP